jgi:hypothetical protein
MGRIVAAALPTNPIKDAAKASPEVAPARVAILPPCGAAVVEPAANIGEVEIRKPVDLVAPVTESH